MGLLLNIHDVVNCAVVESPSCRSCSSELDKSVLVYTSIRVSVLCCFVFFFLNSMSKQICSFQLLSDTTTIHCCS